ncbi:MAG: AAA family ATPase, partial [Planctomycetaceae bacterium]
GRPPQLSELISAATLQQLFDWTDRVHLPRAVADYIARLVDATHADSEHSDEHVRKYVRFGASPRAALALAATARGAALLAGKPNAGFQEVQRVAPSVLGHRLILDYAARLDGWTPLTMAEHLVDSVAHVADNVPEDVEV